jgi:DsbC/DsbD-like thiol-disulfide interchange protein
MTTRLGIYALCLASAFAPLAAPVSAGGPGFAVEDVVDFAVLPGWRTDAGSHIAALQVTLAPGWKTYWRAPGEGGIPPRFDWAGSQNLSRVELHWPTPDVFDQNGMLSLGFEDELVLPIELYPAQPGAGIAMRADLEIGICEDVCIPVKVQLAADLSGAGAGNPRISSAMRAAPQSGRSAGLTGLGCQVDAISDGLRLTATLEMPVLGAKETVVFELPDQRIWVSPASSRRAGRMLTAVTELVPPNAKPFSLNRSDVRITVLSEGRGVEIDGCVPG